VLGKSLGERVFRKPDQPVTVGTEVGGQHMMFCPVVDVSYRLALVRGERSDIYQRRHPFIYRRPDDCTGIGVCGDHDWTFEPLQHVIEHRHVVRQRGHRQWRRDRLYPLGPQAGSNFIPARSIGPATVSQHNG
jgi:hypothetical protein